MWAVGLFILAAVVFAVLVAKGRSVREHSEPPVSIEVDPSPLEDAPPPIPDDELYARQAKEAAARAAGQTADLEHNNREQLAAAEAKLARARKILQESGVWHAAVQVFDEIRNWPNWVKRDDWTLPLELSGLDGGREIPPFPIPAKMG